MVRIFAILVASCWILQVQAGDDIELALTGAEEIVVEGPVEVRISHGEHPKASYDQDYLYYSLDGSVLTFTGTAPTILDIEGDRFQGVKVKEGKLRIQLKGSERLFLSQVFSSDIRVSLTERARFDSDELSAQHVQILLSGQGKASLKNVSATLFELDLSDHGDVEVSGLAQQQQVELSDYAHYDGSALQSEDANVALDDYSAGSISAANTPTIKASLYSSLSSR